MSNSYESKEDVLNLEQNLTNRKFPERLRNKRQLQSNKVNFLYTIQ
jgi:hypothetical protein